MLIAFKVSNFLSFNQKVEFVLRAGTVRELKHHVIEGKGRNDVDILKAAVIYGANASGKSNFIRAVDFASQLIVGGIEKVASEQKHFRLAEENYTMPSEFEFEFKYQGKMYAYGFVLDLNKKKIREAWLFELLKTTDKPVFERVVHENGSSEFSNLVKLDAATAQRFTVYKQDIKDTQLFLSEINEKNFEGITAVQPFLDAFQWFKNNLKIIFPNSRSLISDTVGTDPEQRSAYARLLRFFNTGIIDLETKEYDLEEYGIRKESFEGLPAGRVSKQEVFYSRDRDEYSVGRNENNELKVYKLNTVHPLADANSTAHFELSDESDGTRRIMDFIPMLASLIQSNRTFLVDEIDRSLHPEVTRKVLEFFLENSKGTESQLIVSSHESSLLDLEFLRRDEIWFVEKDKTGASKLYSLEEFKPRHDKEVRKAYLQGRYGAVPFVANVRELGWLKTGTNV